MATLNPKYVYFYSIMSKNLDSLNFVDVSYKISEISFVVAYTVENFRVTRSHNGLGQLFKKSYPEHL